MDKQPHAIRSANVIDAEELRRLHQVNKELLEALESLTDYTEACEGMLNARPAGQVIAARELIAKLKEQT